MIIRTRNDKSPSTTNARFATATDYYESVAKVFSNSKEWESLRLYKTCETSNDLSFLAVKKQTLVVELSGTAAHLSVMDGKSIEAPTHINDVCQLPAGLAARFAWQTIDDTQESLILEFDNALFEKHCPELVSAKFLAGHLLPSNFQQKPELACLVRLLSRELDGAQKRGQLFADCVIRLLCIEIGQSAWSAKLLPVFSAGVADKKIRIVADYVETHFSSDISIADLKNISGLGTTQLISSFKKQMGVTPYAYVMNRRIQYAIRLLQTKDLPIAQIALEAGFSDQQQMTHAFRRRIGRTPGSFRAV